MEILRKRVRKMLSAAALSVVLLGACNGEPAAPKRLNTEAEAVTGDVLGHSNVYAFAYGVGLRAGCDPAEFLPAARQAYEAALERSPAQTQDTANGFNAGWQRGLSEQGATTPNVCSSPVAGMVSTPPLHVQ